MGTTFVWMSVMYISNCQFYWSNHHCELPRTTQCKASNRTGYIIQDGVYVYNRYTIVPMAERASANAADV